MYLKSCREAMIVTSSIITIGAFIMIAYFVYLAIAD